MWEKAVGAIPEKTTTTSYIGGFVYEQATAGEELQFFSHEEGRARPLRDATGAITCYAYDYFIKDHLGNVRMVLTEEQKTDAYPAASMETAQATTEEALYSNVNTTRVDLPSGYPTDTYTNPNDKVAKVNGSGNKIGPAIVLKVMAGDKFNLRVSDYYKLNGSTPSTPANPLTDLLSALTGSIGTLAGSKATTTELQSNNTLNAPATSFLNTQSGYTITKPKAFINWILFDEQFNYVSSSSGFEQVGSDDNLNVHTRTELPVDKSGYLYIYVSNETPNIDVFFDNLQVTHVRGPLLEETHYYPFGLAMAGISSRAAGSLINRRKFNDGTELENGEFSDGSGLELYATDYRSYDPQIGRFHQIDPIGEMMENWSPYVFVHNNPLLYNDPLGLDTNRVNVPIPANVQPGQVISVNTPNGGYSSYVYDPTNPAADAQGLVANGMVAPEMETVTVSAVQNKSVISTTLIDAPQHVDNFDGFWGKVDYYWNGGNVGNSRYGPDGNLRGPALLMGTPPGPSFSKVKLLHLGKIAVNAIKFHRVIKPNILKAAKQVADYAKTVGKNPDILVEGEKIILKGTGPFKGKNFDTGLNPKDFFLE